MCVTNFASLAESHELLQVPGKVEAIVLQPGMGYRRNTILVPAPDILQAQMALSTTTAEPHGEGYNTMSFPLEVWVLTSSLLRHSSFLFGMLETSGSIHVCCLLARIVILQWIGIWHQWDLQCRSIHRVAQLTCGTLSNSDDVTSWILHLNLVWLYLYFVCVHCNFGQLRLCSETKSIVKRLTYQWCSAVMAPGEISSIMTEYKVVFKLPFPLVSI